MRCSLTAIRLLAPFRHLLAVVVRVRRRALLKSRPLTVEASAVGRCHLVRPPDAAELVPPRARLLDAAGSVRPRDPLRARAALVRHPDLLRARAALVRHPDLLRARAALVRPRDLPRARAALVRHPDLPPCPRVAVLPQVPLDRTCPSRIRLTDSFVASPLKVGFQRQLHHAGPRRSRRAARRFR